MRPCSCARRPTDAHMSSRTHPHVYTPMYAHVRTYTRTRRKFSDIKSTLQHCQTEFLHQSDTIHFYYPIAVQSISILAPHWLHTLYKLSSFVTHFPPIYHSLAIIFQLSVNHPIICQANSHLLSLPTIILNNPYTHYIHRYPIPKQTRHPINMSVCYKTLSILYKSATFSSAFSSTPLYRIYRLPPTSPYQIHYNHFHYGNRIPSQSSAIPIMHNYSFIDFRNEIHLNRFV